MGEHPPGLDDQYDERWMYFFIHNVFANFFKDSLDYFAGHLYPRFEHRVVSTYDKAVEYLVKKCQYEGREVDMPMLPALILNPSGDFDLADANAGGRQLWRFPNLDPGLGGSLFIPVYADENVQVTAGFIRLQGDIELLMLLNSFYEYCDLKMLLIQIFGGYERWIYPQYFSTFIILPPDLINYTYSNEYTGVTYKLDWGSAGAYEHLVKTTAKDELVLPVNIKPLYKLTSFNDVSQRYGGTDKLADWRLGATIHYEIEVPAWMILLQDDIPQHIDMELRAGSTYSAYDFSNVPENRWYYQHTTTVPLDATSDTQGFEIIGSDNTCVTNIQIDYQFHTRYFHIITQAEADSETNINIPLPEQISFEKKLIVNSKFGEMNYGDHYVISSDGWTLTFRVDEVDLEKGQIIELYVYKRTDDVIT